MNRRLFLGACVGVSTAAAVTSLPPVKWADLLLGANDRPIQQGTGILVLITLYGGNDGLNTVIPFTDNEYHDARPDLAYRADEVLQLTQTHGLNPGLPGMADMFRDGSLAIVRGVGYPEPDRSHFRSMDIWQSASLDYPASTGWIGRWLDATGDDPLLALHLGRVMPPLAVGKNRVSALLSSGAQPVKDSAALISALSTPDPDDSLAMSMVCESYLSTGQVNRGLERMFDNGATFGSEPELDDNDLASQLSAVAACIAADVPTRVYSVELNGFDTHADERETQQQLLSKLDLAITQFMKKISGGIHAKDVVVMAYSEFGRRVAANASDGTDHGTAGPVFIAGERIKGGFYGDEPSLTELVDDDLRVTTDFRDVYHEILVRGLGSDSEPVLGKGRQELGFLQE